MRVLTLADKTPKGLSFDLADVLRLLMPELAASEWTVSGLECLGEAATNAYEVEQSGKRISGQELLGIAEKIAQTIDGDFRGYRGGRPWVRLRAVDSTSFDVVTSQCGDAFIARYSRATFIPPARLRGCIALRRSRRRGGEARAQGSRAAPRGYFGYFVAARA